MPSGKEKKPKAPVKHPYRLKPKVTRCARAGLVLRAGETIQLTPQQAARHDDVLEPATTQPSKEREGQ